MLFAHKMQRHIPMPFRRTAMKKSKKLVITGTAAAVAAAAFVACVNRPESVYGPPPDEVVSESKYDSSENVSEPVYGPPEDFKKNE